MPNQRIQFGGPTLFEGTFRGDDEVTGLSADAHGVAHAAPADGGHNVQLDGNIQGTLEVLHTPAEAVMVSTNSITGEDFKIDKDSKLTANAAHITTDVEVDGLLTTLNLVCNNDFTCANNVQVDGALSVMHDEAEFTSLVAQTLHSDIVEGPAFSHLDDQSINALATCVQRDETSGVVNIANLRCTARETQLDANGMCPDGLLPGMWVTKGTVSEQLTLVQDGRIFFEPAADNYYRFGAVKGHEGGARDIAEDGLHFSSGTGDQVNSVRVRVSRDHPTLTITGSKDVAELDARAAILVQDADGSAKFLVRPRLCEGEMLLKEGEMVRVFV